MHGTASWPLNVTQGAKITLYTVRFYNFPQHNLPGRNKSKKVSEECSRTKREKFHQLMIVFDLSILYFLLFDEEQRHCHHVVVITGLFPAVTRVGKGSSVFGGKMWRPQASPGIFREIQRFAYSRICSLLQALRQWGRRERKRYAERPQGGKFPPAFYLCVCAFSIQRTRLSLGAWNRLQKMQWISKLSDRLYFYGLNIYTLL